MSFSLEIKRELILRKLTGSAAKAQLGAMIIHCGRLVIAEKRFVLKTTFNQTFIARRFYDLITNCYPVKCELFVIKASKSSKKKQIEVVLSEKVKMILDDLGIMNQFGLNESVSQLFLMHDEDIKAYLGGWFLVSGSVNAPTSVNYHCEFRVKKEVIGRQLIHLFEQFKIQFKIASRRNELFIYTKSAEKISDVLKLIGVNQALFLFEGSRVDRDIFISMTRLENCDYANAKKTQQSAQTQLEAITLLRQFHKLEFMDKKIQDIAILRERYPDYSLSELAQVMSNSANVPISKSGIKHRLDRLVKVAHQMKEKRDKHV